MDLRERLYEEAGFYMPAFFHLQINSNISINFVTSKDENEKQEQINNFKSELSLKKELENDSPILKELFKKPSDRDKKKIIILATAKLGYIQKIYKIYESLQNLQQPPYIAESTFFHEYIHFLQDIFSTIGLINISNTVNVLKGISEYSLKKKK